MTLNARTNPQRADKCSHCGREITDGFSHGGRCVVCAEADLNQHAPAKAAADLQHARLFRLIKAFPLIAHYEPPSPRFDPRHFAEWATKLSTEQAKHAAAFVLGVNNGRCVAFAGESVWWNTGQYAVGRFDPVYAMRVWDPAHRQAFLGWIQNPFWP